MGNHVELTAASAGREVDVPASKLVPTEVSSSSDRNVSAQARKLRTRLRVNNLCCELEAGLIKERLESLEGVDEVRVNVIGRTTFVTHTSTTSAGALADELNKAHLGASVAGGKTAEAAQDKEEAYRDALAWVGALSVVVVYLVGVAGSYICEGPRRRAYEIVTTVAACLGASRVFVEALESVVYRRALDVHCLMALAFAGAVIAGEITEAGAVVAAFLVSDRIQAWSFRLIRRNLRDAAARSTDGLGVDTVMRLRQADKEETGRSDEIVPLDLLVMGDVVAARTGERIPVDGIVVSGRAAVDWSALTGEAVPVEAYVGASVSAGGLVANGYLAIRATATGSASTAQRLRDLVAQAQAEASPTQLLVNWFAAFLAPSALALALLVFAVPVVLGGQPVVWLNNALVLVVVACPCALVLATPVATAAAIVSAADRSLIIKSSAALEALCTVDVVALDKTGTLTQGLCRVVDVKPLGVFDNVGDQGQTMEDATAALNLAAALETKSAHPLAAAIVNYATGCTTKYVSNLEMSGDGGKDFVRLPDDDVKRVKTVAGAGVQGIVAGTQVVVGNSDFCGVEDTEANVLAQSLPGATVVFVAIDGAPRLALFVVDPLRAEASSALASIHARHYANVAILTGDRPGPAAAVADTLLATTGFRPEVLADLKPDDKLAWVQGAQQQGRHVLMVGDGINDAAALAAATVGVAMGSVGTALAVEAADVAVLSDNLCRIPDAIDLARFTRKVILQNIVLALVLRVAVIVLFVVFTGGARLWMAVVADLATFLVVLVNGLRPLRFYVGSHTDSDNSGKEGPSVEASRGRGSVGRTASEKTPLLPV